MCLDGGARRKGEIRTRAGLPHHLYRFDIYLNFVGEKKQNLVLNLLTIPICQLELPRNYVCYLELTGFRETPEVVYLVEKVIKLENIDDPNLPV